MTALPEGGPAAIAVDDGALDATLLELLDPNPDAFADVFLESSHRVTRTLALLRDEEVASPPAARLDQGTALRIVTEGAVGAAHLSGGFDEAVRELARDLARGRGARGAAVAGTTLAARTPPPSDAASVETARILAGVATAARAALARDTRVRSLDVQVLAARRSIHVASSEWGHASDTTAWTTVSIVAEVASASGQRRARASRGRGDLALGEALDAPALVADVVDAAHRRLDARPIAPGRPVLVVAGGAGGILVHEAVGHALEGDVVARGSSFLSGRIGERVAVDELTVLDDPTLHGRAGSYRVDDEGAPTRPRPLIERGVLRGVLLDGARCGFRKGLATGHGRRASFRDQPLPRMSNTCFTAGLADPHDLVASVGDGLLITRLERASVDPVCGSFQLRGTEGWRIEDGRTTAPIQDVLLVGSADRLLRDVDGVGADLAWDEGAGACGREGQWVRVSVGQPTLRIRAGAFGVA